MFKITSRLKKIGPFKSKIRSPKQKFSFGVIRKDLYFYFMESSWIKLISLIFLLYLVSNIIFAFLYSLDPSGLSAINDLRFIDYFFFSVQTMSTIGYGAMSPISFYSNLIVTIEAAFGLIGVAIFTGVVFSKISRPYAKILFSKKMVYSLYDGQKCLAFRLGNTRGNEFVEAKVNVSALVDSETKEGKEFRRILNLPLVRDYSPFFSLTWTVFHPVDKDSPLFDCGVHSKKIKGIVVTVSGHDGTYSNTVYSRYVYYTKDIIDDKYFVDIMDELDDGTMIIDYENFHELYSS